MNRFKMMLSYTRYALTALNTVGFVHPPLSVGDHTITLYVASPDFWFGYDNTWSITVSP